MVPAGKTLTVKGSSVNYSVTNLAVAGNLIIEDSATVTVTGRYDVLKTGHINVKDGTFNASGATIPILTTSGNVIDGNSIELSDAESSAALGTVDVIGTLDVKKGAITSGAITISAGAKMNVADAGNVTVTSIVNNGTMTLGDNAGVTGTITGSGSIVDESGKSTSASAKKQLTVSLSGLTLDTDITVTATGATRVGESGSVYNVDADTVTFTIKNVSNDALTISANTSVTGWTANVSKTLVDGKSTLAKNESLIVTLTQTTSAVTGSITLSKVS